MAGSLVPVDLLSSQEGELAAFQDVLRGTLGIRPVDGPRVEGNPPVATPPHGEEEFGVAVTSTPNNRHGEFVIRSTFSSPFGRIVQEAF